MKAIVQFITGTVRYAVPIEVAREVRSTADLVALPAPREGVKGIVERDSEALTVLSLGGGAGSQFLVLESAAGSFGLVVDEVIGVVRVQDSQVGPAPVGQDSDVVCGVIHLEDGPVMLLDVIAVRRWLETGVEAGLD